MRAQRCGKWRPRLNGDEIGPVPDGYTLLPRVLHAYRVLASDLPAYVPPDGDDD